MSQPQQQYQAYAENYNQPMVMANQLPPQNPAAPSAPQGQEANGQFYERPDLTGCLDVHDDNPYGKEFQQTSQARITAEKKVKSHQVACVITTIYCFIHLCLNIGVFAGAAAQDNPEDRHDDYVGMRWAGIFILVFLGVTLALLWVGASRMKKACQPDIAYSDGEPMSTSGPTMATVGWIILIIHSVWAFFYGLSLAAAFDLGDSICGGLNDGKQCPQSKWEGIQKALAWAIFFFSLAALGIAIWGLVMLCEVRKQLRAHYVKLSTFFGTQAVIGVYGAVPQVPVKHMYQQQQNLPAQPVMAAPQTAV